MGYSGQARGAGRRPRAGQGSCSDRDSVSRPGLAPTLRRCAVYTRKSSEEGLEQEYNSLHAQREACEAYVRSQQHEGWRLLPAAYDDGGLSGGSMQRPALQTLLADIRAGRVDTIVVYKVDRLTRSLADFAKMVEVFDAHAVSFVAVTQQFNTTTSMGRLTLNILLSFAQFEREVTGERIRDKIAASKRRGMWMGGRTPLGYQVIDHKLAVVPEDAATVVLLYRRYLELGCVRGLKEALDAEGIVSRPRTFANGSQASQSSFSRGALYALLSNPVYLGLVRHKDATYPGQHEAIVPAELYAAVQAQLASGNNGVKGSPRARVEPSLLSGKLFDAGGERLVASHARKGERRYRYYVSASLLRAAAATKAQPEQAGKGEATATHRHRPTSQAQPGWRLPARELEQGVWAAAAGVLRQPSALVPDLLAAGLHSEHLPTVLDWLAGLPITGDDPSRQDRHGIPEMMAGLVERIELSLDGMALTLRIGPQPTGTAPPGSTTNDNIGQSTDTGAAVTVRRFVPHRIRRRGVEMRLVIAGAAASVHDDPALLKAIARAHCWFEDLVEGRAASVEALAKRLGITARYVQRLLALALLAPSLVEQIVAGTHPAALTLNKLTRQSPLPLRWTDQIASLDE